MRSQDRVPHWPSADLGLHLNLETLGGFLWGEGGHVQEGVLLSTLYSPQPPFLHMQKRKCPLLPACPKPPELLWSSEENVES